MALEPNTLGGIRQTCQFRTDIPATNQFITTPEWNSYINSSIQELYGLLVEAYGNTYYIQTPYLITTDGVNQQFNLPTDFFKLLGVEVNPSMSGQPNYWFTLKPFNFSERNKFAPNINQLSWGRTNLQYRVVGNTIWFIPYPAGGQTIRLWYVPKFAGLVQDTDTFDGVNGWEEYVVCDVCIKALVKEESDPTAFALQKQALLERIQSEADNRDIGYADTVVDSQGAGMVAGWPGGAYGGGGIV